MPHGGWVFHLQADNTSALSWMAHASRSRQFRIQNLTRAYAALLTFAYPSTFSVTSSHIPGRDNVAADALSRPLQYPTLQSVHQVAPCTTHLPLYRPPSELLSHLHWVVSAPATGEQLESATLKLLQIELHTSGDGAHPGVSPTSPSSTPPRKRRESSSRRTRRRSWKAKV